MSDTITLSADIRETGKKLQTLRSEGLVPAVLYGHGVEPQSIILDHLRFARAFKEAGENTLIALTIGKGKPVNVLVKDAQMHPTTNRYTHADFFQVRMDEVIETAVPITFIGESPAIREQGGILIKALDEVEISALPADIPHTIEADLSKLATFDDVIKISDLPVSKKVEILQDLETVVALVEPPRTEAEMAALNEKVEVDVTKVEGVEKAAEKADGTTEEVSK
ncbi:MAG: 50S ribosomal protein L25 [Candidatus Moranbacteria bacterium]|nr:50S ribosomal protein L25 [Candidatus Moranbacteria bacterium]